MILSTGLESWKIWMSGVNGCFDTNADKIEYDEIAETYIFSCGQKTVALIPRENIRMIERMRKSEPSGLVTGTAAMIY